MDILVAVVVGFSDMLSIMVHRVTERVVFIRVPIARCDKYDMVKRALKLHRTIQIALQPQLLAVAHRTALRIVYHGFEQCVAVCRTEYAVERCTAVTLAWQCIEYSSLACLANVVVEILHLRAEIKIPIPPLTIQTVVRHDVHLIVSLFVSGTYIFVPILVESGSRCGLFAMLVLAINLQVALHTEGLLLVVPTEIEAAQLHVGHTRSLPRGVPVAFGARKPRVTRVVHVAEYTQSRLLGKHQAKHTPHISVARAISRFCIRYPTRGELLLQVHVHHQRFLA